MNCYTLGPGAFDLRRLPVDPPGTPYHPRIGCVRLPPTFQIWCTHGWRSSQICMGEEYLKDQPTYSAKISTGRKTKIKPGLYRRGAPAVAEATAHGLFSDKIDLAIPGGAGSALMLSGGTSTKKPWPVHMVARGRRESWQWRRVKRDDGRGWLRKMFTDSGLGDWELVGPEGKPVATWAESTESRSKDMGVFQFHGPAAQGALGDDFMALAIVSFVHILQYFIVEKTASSAGAAGGAAAGAAAGGGC